MLQIGEVKDMGMVYFGICATGLLWYGYVISVVSIVVEIADVIIRQQCT